MLHIEFWIRTSLSKTLAFNNSSSYFCILFLFLQTSSSIVYSPFSLFLHVCSLCLSLLELGVSGTRYSHSHINNELYLLHEIPKICPFNIIFVKFALYNHWIILILKGNVYVFEWAYFCWKYSLEWNSFWAIYKLFYLKIWSIKVWILLSFSRSLSLHFSVFELLHKLYSEI